MIAGLRLTGSERVLEIGTGYGYKTALLARLAGQVISVEPGERPGGTAERPKANVRRRPPVPDPDNAGGGSSPRRSMLHARGCRGCHGSLAG